MTEGTFVFGLRSSVMIDIVGCEDGGSCIIVGWLLSGLGPCSLLFGFTCACAQMIHPYLQSNHESNRMIQNKFFAKDN